MGGPLRLRAPVRTSSAVTRQPGIRSSATTRLPRPELIARAPAGVRASLIAALQSGAGNAAVQRLLTSAAPSSSQAAGGGISLHGETNAKYDGGTSAWAPRSIKRAKNCTDCADDDPCIHAVGTFRVSYSVAVDITMPDVPGGLSDCQQRRVRTFLRDVLGPHEREHSRRFHTYDGTTTHPVDFTGCGMTALQQHLQEIHDTEEQQRQSSADALSAAIDPFTREVDLDC